MESFRKDAKRNILLGILFFLSFHSTVYAASIDLSAQTQSLGPDDTLTVSASLSINQPDGTEYFLRGVFFRADQPSKLCGFTWNGNDWYSGPITTGQGWTHFLPVVIQNASWSGELKAKPDFNSSYCNTSGDYQFKVIRYTGSGSSNSSESTIIPLSITAPEATKKPEPVTTTEPIQQQATDITDEPIVENVPITTNDLEIQTSDQSEAIQKLNEHIMATSSSDPQSSESVLGVQTKDTNPHKRENPSINMLGFVFMGVGLGIIGVVLLFLYKKGGLSGIFDILKQ